MSACTAITLAPGFSSFITKNPGCLVVCTPFHVDTEFFVDEAMVRDVAVTLPQMCFGSLQHESLGELHVP